MNVLISRQVSDHTLQLPSVLFYSSTFRTIMKDWDKTLLKKYQTKQNQTEEKNHQKFVFKINSVKKKLCCGKGIKVCFHPKIIKI